MKHFGEKHFSITSLAFRGTRKAHQLSTNHSAALLVFSSVCVLCVFNGRWGEFCRTQLAHKMNYILGASSLLAHSPRTSWHAGC